MRTPLYNVNARRKTVSITLNADLVARASALGINISRTAEDYFQLRILKQPILNSYILALVLILSLAIAEYQSGKRILQGRRYPLL